MPLTLLLALSACGPEPAPEDSSTTATPATTTTETTADLTTTGSVTTDPPTTVTPEPITTTATTFATTTIEPEDTTTTTGLDETTGSSTGDTTGSPGIPAWDCPLGWPDTTVVKGTTPLGPIEGRFAGFGPSGGECGGQVTIQFVPTAPTQVDDLFGVTSLYIELSHFQWPNEIILGTGPARFAMRPDGPWSPELAEVMGEVTITSYDPPQEWPYDPDNWPQILGDFTLEGDGWDLVGHFEADLCGNLGTLCP